jgi:hypothetical protein
MLDAEADVRPPLGLVVAAAIVGCSSMGGGGGGHLRLYQGRDLAPVVAAVLDVLPGVGVKFLDARPLPGGGGAIIRAATAVPDPRPFVLVLEISVAQTEGGVHVKATAEPPDRRPAGAERAILPVEAAPLPACPCADPVQPLDDRLNADNMRVMSASRRLVRAVLAALDSRLR